MAWIYLAASEDSVLPWRSGSGQSPIVKMTGMHKPSCSQECVKDHSKSLLFGMMSRALVLNISQQLTLSAAVSPARILVLQEMEQAWKESEADYSDILSDLQEKYVRLSYSLRMSRQLELEDFEKSSEHLPIFGMTVDGRVYLPQKLEPRTLGKDGSYLPTPSASSYGNNRGGGAGRVGKIRHSLSSLASQNGKALSPNFVEWLMGYPTAWTVLNASVIPWFHSKQKQLLKG